MESTKHIIKYNLEDLLPKLLKENNTKLEWRRGDFDDLTIMKRLSVIPRFNIAHYLAGTLPTHLWLGQGRKWPPLEPSHFILTHFQSTAQAVSWHHNHSLLSLHVYPIWANLRKHLDSGQQWLLPLTTRLSKEPHSWAPTCAPPIWHCTKHLIVSHLVWFRHFSYVLMLIPQHACKLLENRTMPYLTFVSPIRHFTVQTAQSCNCWKDCEPITLTSSKGGHLERKSSCQSTEISLTQADQHDQEAKEQTRKSVCWFPMGEKNRPKCSGWHDLNCWVSFPGAKSQESQAMIGNHFILFYFIALRSHFCRNQNIIELLTRV